LRSQWKRRRSCLAGFGLTTGFSLILGGNILLAVEAGEGQRSLKLVSAIDGSDRMEATGGGGVLVC
jgi:hypothetical protein